jgi:hypothetical protein
MGSCLCQFFFIKKLFLFLKQKELQTKTMKPIVQHPFKPYKNACLLDSFHEKRWRYIISLDQFHP